MEITILDVETTIKNKGNPFTRSNTLVRVGLKPLNSNSILLNPDETDSIQRILDSTELIVGFNIKFDLHWLKRYGYSFSHCRIWDCQLAEFLLCGQRGVYPSLNRSAEQRGLGTKLDIVKDEYWAKGIDTDVIPLSVLDEYLEQDLVLTEKLYEVQVPLIKNQGLLNLFRLQCLDLLVLQDMEYNGIVFDVEKANKGAKEEEEKIKEIEKELSQDVQDVPINWGSRDHLSCYIYGGTIEHIQRLEVGVYKTGPKIGLPRYKILRYKTDLPRLVEPPKGSELLKEGYYATDDGTLRSIKTSKATRRKLDLILDRAKSSKLLGTYYRGLPELIETMDWTPGTIHGTFNQCVAATGRLSSSKPNLQNFAGQIKSLLVTRYV